MKEASKYDENDVFVIGGGSIYKAMLPYCNTAYVTYINQAYSADTFIPNLDKEVDGFWLMKVTKILILILNISLEHIKENNY